MDVVEVGRRAAEVKNSANSRFSGMGVRFSGLGHNRPSAFRRERLLFFGGSTLLFALIVIGALLVYSNTVVQAREDVVVEPANDSEVTFGTVVLIAPTSRVPKGTKLTGAYLREVHWPRDQVPEGAVRSIQDVESMYANAALPANQPILRSSIAVNPPSFGIGELLPAGHRAVTIEVDAISGVEGWATPGAHVDVFLTYFDQKEGVHKTRVAVEDAVVLSYGGEAKKTDQFDNLEKTTIASTVTLAVPFEDSLKIQTAKAIGQITLVLRGSNDLGSQGRGEFSAKDWDSRPSAPKTENKFVPKGHATFTDPTGTEQQFVLGNDDRWWKSAGEE